MIIECPTQHASLPEDQRWRHLEWKDASLDSMTFMSGIPTGTKELYYEMREYYNYSMTMLQDIMYAVAF
jgi:hypothetical protein